MKVRYELAFRYVDNDEQYSDSLELTDQEKANLMAALEALLLNGEIYGPDGESDTDYMLIEYAEPVFLTLEELRENWTAAYLQDRLTGIGFEWPAS